MVLAAVELPMRDSAVAQEKTGRPTRAAVELGQGAERQE
jgi:hypothetical protein